MNAKELIFKKRQKGEHSRSELESLIRDYVRGNVPDYQMSAWLMAVFFNGMTARETADLTKVMWESGKTFPRPTGDTSYWIDKHSTGGVGDKTSLILVPLVIAVCRRLMDQGQVKIPMVSGRGLGHTGGTLDKLEAVSGFNVALDFERAAALLKKNEFFMIGQTADVAPADRLVYALRDSTSTVESLPLMVSSILSKKLSENLNGVVFDVKSGTGAFLKTREESRQLARAMISVCQSAHVDAVAVITNMNEPLGRAAGHSLEVEECANFLRDSNRDPGLERVTIALASWMVHLASRGKVSIERSEQECVEELTRKDAFEIFKTMFKAQGGDWDSFEIERKSQKEKLTSFVYESPRSGYVAQVEPEQIGNLLSFIGGGRNKKEDQIDPEVGILFERKVGDLVKEGDVIVRVLCRHETNLNEVTLRLDQAVKVSKEAQASTEWILEKIN